MRWHFVLQGRVRWMIAGGALCLGVTCTTDVDEARRRAADLAADAPNPKHRSGAKFREPRGDGLLVYLGMDVDPPMAEPGASMVISHYWKVERAPLSDAEIRVRGTVGSRTIFRDAHPPMYGRLTTSSWKQGDIWIDRHVVAIPSFRIGGTLSVFVGLHSGPMRWTVEALPGQQDGADHLRVAELRLRSPAAEDDGLPMAVVARATGPIVADGRLDEADWADAPVLTFDDSLGRKGAIQYATRLRLLYDDRNLYVGFEADDRDVTDRFRQRDDPIYDHECVELFIMPHVSAPETGPYVELQASPRGVIFDAAFTGPRRGMDRSFQAGQTVGTSIEGSLNDPTPDRGWVSEWKVPFSNLRGVREAPRPGAEWRMNAFRIEKYRARGDWRAEYSAWSPPGVGDFHHVARFGRMRFGEIESP